MSEMVIGLLRDGDRLAPRSRSAWSEKRRVALHHPDHLSTALTVTGGIVSVVFTGYVFSKTYEKVKNGNGNGNGNHQPPPTGDENGAGD